MAQTLDQQRAALAWGYATASRTLQGDLAGKYRNLAKGAPALIMNSGLMPTLAFYKGKGQAEQQLLNDLMSALVQRLKPNMVPRDFQAFKIGRASCRERV